MKKVLCLLLLINLCKLNSQTIEGFKRISKQSYSYKNQIEYLHKFEEVFKTNPELYDDFESFNSGRKIQKNLNYIGIPIAVIGFGSALLNESTAYDDSSSTADGIGTVIGFGFGMIGGVFVMIGNGIGGSKKNSAKIRLLKKMNLTEYGSNYESEDIQLELKATNNGIGLVYTF